MTKASHYRFLAATGKLAGVVYASLFLIAAEAGGQDLFLFREVPYSPSSSRGDQVSVDLYRLTSGRLIPLRLPVQAPRFTRFVIVDTELRMIALGGSPLMPSGIQVTSMDNAVDVRTFELNVPDLSLAQMHFADVPNDGKPLVVDLYNSNEAIKGKPLKETLQALNVATGQWAAVSPDVYQFIRINGGTAGYRPDNDDVGLQVFEDGRLMIPVAQRLFPVGPALPVDLRFGSKQVPRLYLNNKYLAAVADDLLPVADETVYQVLDRKTGDWRLLRVPGNSSRNVRAFGPWIAGMVDEGLGSRNFRLSPGRHRPTDDQIVTVDDYLENEKIYRPGTLFVYNVTTHRYYQWDTQDGDSEVILIQDDQVYYRVDHTIYRASIGEKALEKPGLLVESPEVPGIHWAFFGPRAPLTTTPLALKP